MNNIESNLVQTAVHCFINSHYNNNSCCVPSAPQPEGTVVEPQPPTPPTPPDQIVNELSDFLKTYIRVKTEIKHIKGNEYCACYKDSYKNGNTYYFYL